MIKNIVFDLGGVLVDLKRDACVEAFSKIGFDGFGDLLNNYIQGGIFLQYEKGEISTEMFREWIRDNINPANRIALKDSDIDRAMGAFLDKIPDFKLDLILELRSKYRVFMLSNTNPIALQVVKPFFNYKSLNFSAFFEKAFFSFEMGFAKPDSEIFIKMVEIAAIIPEETLFIDDFQKNIETAKMLGFKVLHYNSGMNFEKEIYERLLL